MDGSFQEAVLSLPTAAFAGDPRHSGIYCRTGEELGMDARIDCCDKIANLRDPSSLD